MQERVAIGRVDGQDVIISGGDDGTVQVWNAATGREQDTLTALRLPKTPSMQFKPHVSSRGGRRRAGFAGVGSSGDGFQGHSVAQGLSGS
ncbi:hypothetical protein ITP53_28700 [Nonomuraea sp. K274]|uniref:WD40 repeat protein n=1 Tax=Nonomuraea cypriaca TaxID=1187855 RepID=A0A931AD07_9ACTN|nr:hypothetical protein [Nonomuraea cypriaca]MBF8189643.1 hypothetical protein [Nonomuraea cypriaca]